MANQQRSPVGYRPFKTDPILEDSLLSVPRNDGGEFENRVAAGFQRMGMQFGERADRAAQTLGELEGKRDAIEGAPGAEQEFRPTRRDSIRGRAYDKAGTQIYLEQLDQTMINEQKAAYEKYGQSPEKLKGALKALLTDHMGKYVFEEIAPEYKLAFESRATKLYEASQKAAAARARAAAARAAAASRAQYIKAQQDNLIDLQRQAMNMGADPDGESAVNDQLDLIRTDLQAAAASGRITQKQAEKLSEGAALTVARGTIQAKFDAAETADDKAAFAEDLKKAWLADDEKLGIYRNMPFEDIEKVSAGLQRDVEQLRIAERQENQARASELEDLIADDVASMGATGQGVDLEESGLTPENVERYLGPEVAREWQESRSDAGRFYDVTAAMPSESALDIAERLESLRPEPGAAGFVRQQQTYEAAREHAKALLEERAVDPLGQAERAGMVELAPIDLSEPDALVSSISGRQSQRRQVERAYGQAVPFFRPGEQERLSSALLQNPAAIAGFSQTLVNTLGPQAIPVLSELSEAAPVVAHTAGMAQATGDMSVAADVAEALQFRRDKVYTVKMPDQATQTQAALAEVGPAFLGSPRLQTAVLQTANILFEKAANEQGFDPAEVDEPGTPANEAYLKALDRAAGGRRIGGRDLGGFAEVNGQKIIVPPDLEKSAPQDLLDNLTALQLEALPPIQTGDFDIPIRRLRNAQLVGVGDGLYRMALGDPLSDDPQYLVTPEGDAWVLDIRQLADIEARTVTRIERTSRNRSSMQTVILPAEPGEADQPPASQPLAPAAARRARRDAR
ncbi:hypothetical protein [Martelella sp. FOR1707]